MRQVIKSDAESGDGVSIEREQPSTAFRPIPHIVTFDGLFATQAGFQEPDDFLKLGDIKGAFQADELTGKFDAVSGVRDFSGDISGIAWGDPDRQQLEGQAFLREQGFAVRGEGRPTKIWTSGSGTSFEHRIIGVVVTNDAVFGMRENLGGTLVLKRVSLLRDCMTLSIASPMVVVKTLPLVTACPLTTSAALLVLVVRPS